MDHLPRCGLFITGFDLSIVSFKTHEPVVLAGIRLALSRLVTCEIIPTNQWLVTLPGFNLLRVPARGLFFLDTALVIAAMIALDHLIKNNPDKAMYLRLGTIFFTVLVILVQIFVTGANPEKNSFLIWHSFCWLIIACLILFFSYRKITARLFLICMGFTAVGDVLISDLNLIEWRTVSETLADGMEEAR